MRTLLKKYLPPAIGKYLNLLFIISPKKAVKKAVYFFSTPKKGKVEPDQEYFLEEAEDDVVPFKNINLQTYRWAGDGETILLVHGWESNTHRWKVLIEKLQELNYNVVAFDAPAHGYSTGPILNVPLYADCLHKIAGLYRPHYIFGHSVGAMATMFYQYKFKNPEIKKLVVLAPPTNLTTIMNDFQKILRLNSKFMTALDSYFKKEYGYYFFEFSMVRFAEEIDVPGLLIHDTFDEIAPFQEAKEIASAWKNLKFITTENYGHSLYFEEVDNEIISFLK